MSDEVADPGSRGNQEKMAIDDRLCQMNSAGTAGSGRAASRTRGSAYRVTGHQNSLRLLDGCPPSKRALQTVVLGEALKGDVDRALRIHAALAAWPT